MSEYWKSTPKYWCKYCSVFVKDTKFERQQHDAKPRHQGGIQRSLRELHKGKEREDREKQRAQNEIARLNGVVGGKTTDAPKAQGGSGKTPAKQTSAEERKRQMQQLADMGVAVPEEFRREVALAGDWERVSVKPVDTAETMRVKSEGGEANVESLAFGIRKRKFEDQIEEEAIHAVVKRQAWGSKFKTYPGKGGTVDSDVDALLDGLAPKKEVIVEEETEVKPDTVSAAAAIKSEQPSQTNDEGANLDVDVSGKTLEPEISENSIKAEEESKLSVIPELPGAGIVFKKRKPKGAKKT
ncbi:U1 zinc finger domain protein [Venturia nashicola]|uniref:U1 zinc finger domain protein n=1 Tax=Venturia nashicola TaxID=86259 RepID=A0A4Z1P012_9PEZI|nr:U1 zinc finger domain protein [Venturia nashicola]TLD34912.1 U1 zinc finger domain protein [Venturia nashicola]